jgi:predicted nucleic-acid-binding Zn-ribbon protein
MSVLTRDGRVCPICGRTNYVKMEVVSVPKGFVFHVTATCADCGYEFLFGAAGMIYGIGLVGAVAIFVVAIWKQINIGGACVVGLMVLALCLIIIALMANAALFEGYIDRQILKKAERMAREGRHHNDWTGDTYTNKNGLAGKEGIRRS